MGALVQYRDLPGGPKELQFCDELTRHCLCTNCNMLSMSMWQDQNRHMFCETCLMETSEKHHRQDIHCKYENKQVSIFEMYEASDLLTVVRDQHVLCPNPKCKTAVTLDELKHHYIQCQPTVMCSTCGGQVRTAKWSDHSKECHARGDGKTPPKKPLQQQVLPKGGFSPPEPTLSFKMDSKPKNGSTVSSMYPSTELQQAEKPTDKSSDKMMQCPHCARKVKERNMAGHMEKCTKAPQPCVYCEKEFNKDDMQLHHAVCKRNPDNHQQGPEKTKKAVSTTKQATSLPQEAPNTDAASPPQASGGEKASYSSALQHGIPAGGNASTGTRSHSVDDHFNRGDPTEEKQPPSLHSGQKTLQQTQMKDEVENSEKVKRHDGKRRQKKDPNVCVKKTCVQVRPSIGYTKEDPTRDQLQPAAEQDCLPSTPPQLDTESSSTEGGAIILNKTQSIADNCYPNCELHSGKEMPALFAVTAHSFSEASNLKRETCCSEATLFDNREDSPVLHNATKKERAPKVENISTSGGDSDREEYREFLASKLESQNDHIPSMISKESELLTGHEANFNSATEGNAEADSFSNAAHFVPPTEAEVLPVQGNDSTECETDSTTNEPVSEFAHQTLEVHPESAESERASDCVKCEACGIEATSFGSQDEADHLHVVTNIETAGEAEDTSTFVGGTASKEKSEFLASLLHSPNDHTLNMTCNERQFFTGHEVNFSSATVGAMQADSFCIIAHVVSPTEAEALPVQGNDSTEYKTPSTMAEPHLEVAHRTRNAQSLVHDSAPVTANDRSQCSRSEAFPTDSGFGILETTPEPSHSQPREFQACVEAPARRKAFDAKEDILSDEETERSFSRKAVLRGSRGNPATLSPLTSDKNSSSSQLCQKLSVCGKSCAVGGQGAEASLCPDSVEMQPIHGTRWFPRGRGNCIYRNKSSARRPGFEDVPE